MTLKGGAESSFFLSCRYEEEVAEDIAAGVLGSDNLLTEISAYINPAKDNFVINVAISLGNIASVSVVPLRRRVTQESKIFSESRFEFGCSWLNWGIYLLGINE